MWPHEDMKQVKIAELKSRLSAHLRAVERGAELEVTDRQRPIVRLMPVATSPGIRLQPPQRSFLELRRKRYPRAGWPVKSLDVLVEERGRR
jgi:prevent-host-death family protein